MRWKGCGGSANAEGRAALPSKHPQSQIPSDPECQQTTPSVYFWYRTTLKASDSIEDGGPVDLSMILPLLLSCCLVGAFMIHGLKSFGKVSRRWRIP